MGVKLTEHQMMILKRLVEFAEASANQIYHIMENHGLDKVEGLRLKIDVAPEYPMIARSVQIGFLTNIENDVPGGYCNLVSSKGEQKYAPCGKNSPEYELLFADEAIRSSMEKAVHREKPLPPDGLWVCSNCNSDPVDNWEWDVNDSLS